MSLMTLKSPQLWRIIPSRKSGLRAGYEKSRGGQDVPYPTTQTAISAAWAAVRQRAIRQSGRAAEGLPQQGDAPGRIVSRRRGRGAAAQIGRTGLCRQRAAYEAGPRP